MQIVRRHRRVILFVIGLLALGGMTYGYLKRIGVDPLAPERDAGVERARP
ncbi:MAG TPA: hypothetical protein RMH85_03000 [Polyangiaceae bacterium LLY-WYZ-15_(1-7)]|nr:hypothetical protein [Polyangiaceae bacterium LLY-WYZ-15_(1-7)]HJL04649.1 hypothetical protein [Polyangiaceae bacterium LLY-WYZ-15_(1-7)]HJL07431.1 hypothetical protein [Polyangiaceae bacterium LLY-WYZ-15_(1-7)]HJL22197.1 hypothetical protein [Polyangiaceae bacterium LLY-WYZ-15_(1-7)]HJL32502.1 hypothetical protein [Polyangiaceae bacterium LLY-WYZ-15_(1-7)]